MEEARQAKDREMALEEEIAIYAAQRGLTDEQTQAFEEVFDLLDLDGGGLISDKELRLGLQSIHMDLSKEEITQLTDQIDPKDEGINVVGFMKFMMMTPKYRDGAAEAKRAFIKKQKEDRMNKKHTLSEILYKQLLVCFPFLDTTDNELREEVPLHLYVYTFVYHTLPLYISCSSLPFTLNFHSHLCHPHTQAALVLQDAWRARKAKMDTLRVIEAKKKEATEKLKPDKESTTAPVTIAGGENLNRLNEDIDAEGEDMELVDIERTKPQPQP
jgi:hypothetical protein